MEETVSSLDELSSYFKKADDFLSSTQLFQWVLIKSNMKELPQVKYALTIFVVHAAMGGGSTNTLLQLFNDLYSGVREMSEPCEPV